MFNHLKKGTTSDKKTAIDSDFGSHPITPRKEFATKERDNSSIQLNDSWQVVEGSSIIMEVESSYRTESNASKRNKKLNHDMLFDEPVKLLDDSPVVDMKNLPEQLEQLHNSRKSSESHTATFASIKGLYPIKKEEVKIAKSQKGTKVKDGPFEYDGPNSEVEDYDSEQEFSYHSNKVNFSNAGSQWNPTKEVKSVVPNDDDHIMPESSSAKTIQKISSTETDHDGWIGSSDEKHAVKTVYGRGNDSQTSHHLESLSTHTSPNLQSHSKLLNHHKLQKVKKKHDNYVSQKEFKNFISSTKRQIISEKSSPRPQEKKKRFKSPLNIVDKLVEDANQRLRNKQKNEHLGQGNAFASVFSQFNKTLRTKSVQPQTRKSRFQDSSV